MIEKGKIVFVLFLLISLVVFSGNSMAAVKKGAKLSIQKTDGEMVTGELITVKRDSLLLVNETDGYDLTVNVDEIDNIVVRNKPLTIEFAVLGFLAGAVTRGLMHTEIEKGEVEEEATAHQVQKIFVPGLIGAGAGALIGTAFAVNKKIQIRGNTDADVQEALEKLSKRAREPNFQ